MGVDLTKVNKKIGNTGNIVLSKFTETPTASETCHAKRRVLTFENSDDSDYQVLQEFASNAVTSFSKQNESDDDLFSMKYTQILPLPSCEEKIGSNKSPGKKQSFGLPI